MPRELDRRTQQQIAACIADGMSLRCAARTVGCDKNTVDRYKRLLAAGYDIDEETRDLAPLGDRRAVIPAEVLGRLDRKVQRVLAIRRGRLADRKALARPLSLDLLREVGVEAAHFDRDDDGWAYRAAQARTRSGRLR